jgi:hypothetical protein
MPLIKHEFEGPLGSGLCPVSLVLVKDNCSIKRVTKPGSHPV